MRQQHDMSTQRYYPLKQCFLNYRLLHLYIKSENVYDLVDKIKDMVFGRVLKSINVTFRG